MTPPSTQPHLSPLRFGPYSLNKEDTISSQDQSSCPTHCHGPAAHHGPLVADFGGGGWHKGGGAGARRLCGEGEQMVRGGRAPQDASHGDVPKLPLAGYDDESGDGTVHGTFTALTQDPEGPRVPPVCNAHAGPSLVLHRTCSHPASIIPSPVGMPASSVAHPWVPKLVCSLTTCLVPCSHLLLISSKPCWDPALYLDQGPPPRALGAIRGGICILHTHTLPVCTSGQLCTHSWLGKHPVCAHTRTHTRMCPWHRAAPGASLPAPSASQPARSWCQWGEPAQGLLPSFWEAEG